jgi:hypothetical protein
VFATISPTAARFSEGKSQAFPDSVTEISMNNFFFEGNDFTKSGVGYYPLMIQMKSVYSG